MMSEEEVAQLLPGGHRSRWQVEQPHARDAGEGHGQPVCYDLVVAPSLEDSFFLCQQEGLRVGRAVIARWHVRLELARPLHLSQGGDQGSEPPGLRAGVDG